MSLFARVMRVFFASDSTNVVADVVGYFGAPGATGSLTFHPIEACTGVNTQWAGGPYGGPALDAYSSRDFPIGQAPVCAMPGWARAYSLNFLATPMGALTGLNAQPMGFGNVTSFSLYAADGQETASAGHTISRDGRLDGYAVQSHAPDDDLQRILRLNGRTLLMGCTTLL